MKPRLIIDGILLWGLVIGSIALCLTFPKLYLIESRRIDMLLNILGIIFILKGCLLRMAARGHKRKFPRWDLVITGVYSVVRNPMYMGSFIICIGFILVGLPWWIIPIFFGLFMWRFMIEIKKEEAQLLECHKVNYETYAKATPRFWPSLNRVWQISPREVFPIDELFTTYEARNIFLLPLAAGILDLIVQYRLFGAVEITQTAILFVVTIIGFVMIMAIEYQLKK